MRGHPDPMMSAPGGTGHRAHGQGRRNRNGGNHQPGARLQLGRCEPSAVGGADVSRPGDGSEPRSGVNRSPRRTTWVRKWTRAEGRQARVRSSATFSPVPSGHPDHRLRPRRGGQPEILRVELPDLGQAHPSQPGDHVEASDSGDHQRVVLERGRHFRRSDAVTAPAAWRPPRRRSAWGRSPGSRRSAGRCRPGERRPRRW